MVGQYSKWSKWSGQDHFERPKKERPRCLGRLNSTIVTGARPCRDCLLRVGGNVLAVSTWFATTHRRTASGRLERKTMVKDAQNAEATPLEAFVGGNTKISTIIFVLHMGINGNLKGGADFAFKGARMPVYGPVFKGLHPYSDHKFSIGNPPTPAAFAAQFFKVRVADFTLYYAQQPAAGATAGSQQDSLEHMVQRRYIPPPEPPPAPAAPQAAQRPHPRNSCLSFLAHLYRLTASTATWHHPRWRTAVQTLTCALLGPVVAHDPQQACRERAPASGEGRGGDTGGRRSKAVEKMREVLGRDEKARLGSGGGEGKELRKVDGMEDQAAEASWLWKWLEAAMRHNRSTAAAPGPLPPPDAQLHGKFGKSAHTTHPARTEIVRMSRREAACAARVYTACVVAHAEGRCGTGFGESTHACVELGAGLRGSRVRVPSECGTSLQTV
ncbi:hypothetical protein M427DRAFT_143155 [Gonapodya prolifera JEL478]|uniref:Uncharacterized protein n=1 Tax=Gonapodya prolifera (strain JEL478) TaxID=1344416 RepID=A0A139AT59_GONPJ|nr:hypothetical protein M427DRAFT_143155 [Gonapodya prolifera JEL478]|eukprot:KXS19916.1 hypothetical protein M427DRAFT_143155 [Gonapodya prolifera JEL478]